MNAFRTTAVVLAAMLTACISNRVSMRDLDRAEGRWQASGIIDYSFKLGVSSLNSNTECAARFEAVAVEVRGGRTTRFGTCDTNSKFAQSFGSIPAIFSTLRAERAEKPPELKVRFNQDFGYPERIFINYERWMTDYSLVYFVSEFHGEIVKR